MNCPSSDQLKALCDGTIAECEADQLFEHIRECSACEGSLDAIEVTATNDFRRRILEAARSGPYCDEPQLSVALSLIRDRHPEPMMAARFIDSFPFDLGAELCLVKEISAGGVGTVFEARETSSQRRCAVKMLNVDHLSQTSRRRFLREIQLLLSLDHPNIISILKYGHWNGVPYLVTEHIEGDSLAERIRANGPLRVADALRYALQAANGLRYAHSKSIIHRDLSPANLLVDPDEMVRIIDLGLAKALRGRASAHALREDLTPDGIAAGTRPYMSPEQLEGLSNADERSDVYSLGATLAYLLTGSAFGKARLLNESPSAIRQAGGTEPAVEGAQALPDCVKPVLQQMLAEEPARRYQTMDAVALALAETLQAVLGA